MKSNAKAVMKRLQNKMKKIQSQAPKVLANEGVKVFLNNFKTESFEGDEWDEVDRRIPGTYSYKYPKGKGLARRTRPILIGRTRKLRNSVVNSVKEANVIRIKWGSYLPYSDRQNDDRPFMKVGKKLRSTLTKKYESMFKAL